MDINRRLFALISGGALLFVFVSQPASGQVTSASLFFGPASGTFVVGSTFTVSVFVNTGGQQANAVQSDIVFPADKLQVVSPSAGKSFIGIWVVQPTYDNRVGTIHFQGAIPTPGINTSQGLVSEITFRVTGVGTAIVKFDDSSRVLLNDGKGTDVLGQTTAGFYKLTLPPPAGPIVSSPTHPDQERWYPQNDALFNWGSDEKVQAYSYLLSDQPVDIPDDISEGEKTSQDYRDLIDGVHYFHVKALRNGSWGGVTHFSVKVDASSPADFKIDIAPAPKTSVHKPILNFATTDEYSGIDHYELKIISLLPTSATSSGQGFFIEANSPYVSELDLGEYDIVVRAFDKAGNYRQSIERLYITNSFFTWIAADGIRLTEKFVISWPIFWSLLSALILVLLYFAWHFWHWHHELEDRRRMGVLPKEVQDKLDELKTLRERYKGVLVLFAVFGLMGLSFLSGTRHAFGAVEPPSRVPSPPIVTVFPKNISNQEIFYIGGNTAIPNTRILIYLQGVTSGETYKYTTISDSKGEWFYTQSNFLGAGDYLFWAQTEAEGQESPPSAQFTLHVENKALEWGASRLSYEAFYLLIAGGLFFIVLILLAIIYYYFRRAKTKRAHIEQEMRKVEDSLRRGFAMLHRDIETELVYLKKARATGKFGPEEQKQEEKILKDLELVKNYLGKEVWEIVQELK